MIHIQLHIGQHNQARDVCLFLVLSLEGKIVDSPLFQLVLEVSLELRNKYLNEKFIPMS